MKTKSISAGLAVHARTIATTRQLIFRGACLWPGFLAFAAIACGFHPAQAAITEAWVQRYGSEAGSQGNPSEVVTDAAGNIFVAGSTANQTGGGEAILVIKYSGAGVPLWTNRYYGPTRASAVAVDGTGNVFVTGEGDSDYATIAYSGAGVPLWTNRYNGTGNGSDEAIATAVDASGTVFVTGSSAGSDGYDKYATIAYSGTGVPLWTNRYGGSNDFVRATAMAVNGSGNVFVTGYGFGLYHDFATIAYSALGVPLWTNRYSRSAYSYDKATAVAVDASGNVFVTGSTGSSSYDFEPFFDYVTIAYSGAGVSLWTNRYQGPARYDQATAVAVDGSGNVFVTGSSVGSDGYDEYATIAYSGAGVSLWTNRYNGPENGNDIANAVAVDGSGNVFVTGSSARSDGYDEYATIAYSGAGVPLWTNRYNGPENGFEIVNAVAVDGSGNVFVTGVGGEGDSDFVTVKYVWRPEIAINLLSTGVRVRFTGLPGHSYNVERAPAVTGPWNTINTQTAPASGPFEYLDTNPPAAAGFYRTSEP